MGPVELDPLHALCTFAPALRDCLALERFYRLGCHADSRVLTNHACVIRDEWEGRPGRIFSTFDSLWTKIFLRTRSR